MCCLYRITISTISWNINKQLENIAWVRKKAIKNNEIQNMQCLKIAIKMLLGEIILIYFM